jgi:hypothetical protein
MPAKKAPKDSIEDLKKELAHLQEKIADYESPAPPHQPVIEVKELYSWKAPERIFVPRNKKWFSYIFLLVLLILLILLFLRQWMVMAPVLAIAFVSYVLASVPPEDIDHKLTTQGLNSNGHSYLWNELGDFWFTKKHGDTILNIDTYLNFPRRLFLLIGKADQEKIKDTMVQYIPYREIPKTTWIDRVADWLSAKFHKVAG